MLVVLSMLLSAPVWAAEKNPFEPDDFIKMSKEQDKNELISDKTQLQEDYNNAQNAFRDAKKDLHKAMRSAVLSQFSGDTSDAAGDYIDALWDSLTGKISKDSQQKKEAEARAKAALGNMWESFKEFATNTTSSLFNLGIGVFANDRLDAKNLLEHVQSQYAGNEEVINKAKALFELGKKSYELSKKLQAIDDIEATDPEVYAYVANGQTILFKKVEYAFQSWGGQEAGEFMFGKYEALGSTNTRGCMPLPAKLAESRSCIFCPLFLTIFNAAQTMSTNSFGVLGMPLGLVMVLGFAIYIAFVVLKYVSGFTRQDAPRFVNELLIQGFKVLAAFLMLLNASTIYTYAIGPVLSAGMDFGSALMFENGGDYMEWCQNEENIEQKRQEMVSGVDSYGEKMSQPLKEGLLPSYLYVKLSCFIRSVQAEISKAQAIGSTLMCVARHEASDANSFIGLWDFSMFFQGLAVWAMAIIISLAFAFYLIDATVRLGIVGALMPFFIACWPFKKTAGYTKNGWTMFLNTFFTYAMMGLVVSVNLQLIFEGLGGMGDLESAINGNDIDVLTNLLDIGLSGFLVLLACCLFAWKLTGQACALASTFASAPGKDNIGSSIGTLAASGATGVAKAGMKGVGKVSSAVGLTAGVNRLKDSAARKLGLGRFSRAGKAGSGAGGPIGPAGGQGAGGAPATPEQLNQQNDQLQQQQSQQHQSDRQQQQQSQQRDRQNAQQDAQQDAADDRRYQSQQLQDQDRIRQTQSELNGAESKAKQQRSTRDQAQNEANNARQDMDKAKGTPQEDAMRKKYEAAKKKVDAENAKLKQAEARVNALRQQLQQHKQTALNHQVQHELNEQFKQGDRARRDLANVDSDIQQNNRSLQKSQNTINAYQQGIKNTDAALSRATDSKTIADLNAVKLKMQTGLAAEQQHQQGLLQRKDELEARRNALTGRVDNTPDRNAYRAPETMNDKVAYERTKIVSGQMEARANGNAQQIQQLNEIIQTSNDAQARRAAQQKKARLEQELAALQQQIDALNRQAESLFNNLSRVAGTAEYKERIARGNQGN